MACENPKRRKNPRYNLSQSYEFWNEYYRDNYDMGIPDPYIDIPCGKCYSCRKSKVNAWRLRLSSEFTKYPNSVFITLTFDDFNLKRFKYNPNRAVRLWLDRVRKLLGKQVRHFIIGEYGEKTSRFHYHGILFNVPKSFNSDVLSSTWKYGFVYLGWCTNGTINYILKYITKVDDYGTMLKLPRIIASKGLGKAFVEQYANEPIKTECKPFVTRFGKKIPLPRYLKDALYDEDEKAFMRLVHHLQPFEKYVNGIKYNNYADYRLALADYFKSNVSLGLSPKPIRKVKPEIKPIAVRYIVPYTLDFYSPRELTLRQSDFSVDNIPF